MRTYENGVYRDATLEEIKTMEEAQAQLPPPVPSDNQEIEELKSRLANLERIIVREASK